MERRLQGSSPEDSNEAQHRRRNFTDTSITRRRYLVVGAALAMVSGCVGDEGDQSDAAGDTDDATTDDPSDDAAPPADDDDSTDNGDDPSDDGDQDPDAELDVREDFETYILELTVTYEGPDGEWSQHVYRETDVTTGELYQSYEMTEADGEPATFEQYIVDGEAYQIMPDGSCGSTGEEAILVHGETLGDFSRPDPEEVDTEADHITYEDTTSVGWVDEPVHVWEFDLAATFGAIEGVMQMYVGVESGYLVGYEGWYTTGAHDDPAEITFEYHRHSFDQDVEIEIPDECTGE